MVVGFAIVGFGLVAVVVLGVSILVGGCGNRLMLIRFGCLCVDMAVWMKLS